MKKAKIERNNSDRRRDALVAAGIPPSSFGRIKGGQAHRDRKKELARGERKHKGRWE